MAKRNGLDFIYVVWKDVKSRKNFVIGTLTRNGCYEFRYGKDLEEAQREGFTPLVLLVGFQIKSGVISTTFCKNTA